MRGSSDSKINVKKELINACFKTKIIKGMYEVKDYEDPINSGYFYSFIQEIFIKH